MSKKTKVYLEQKEIGVIYKEKGDKYWTAECYKAEMGRYGAETQKEAEKDVVDMYWEWTPKNPQKFHKYNLVKVDVTSPYKSHFPTNYYGIVAHSYAEKFGGNSNDDYSIITLDNDLTKAVNQYAWYNEQDLTLSDKLTRKQVKELLKDLQWIDL